MGVILQRIPKQGSYTNFSLFPTPEVLQRNYELGVIFCALPICYLTSKKIIDL